MNLDPYIVYCIPWSHRRMVSRQSRRRKMRIDRKSWVFFSEEKRHLLYITGIRCVLWCLARSLLFENALEHPICEQEYGFSPVCDLRCIFKFSCLEKLFVQLLNVHLFGFSPIDYFKKKEKLIVVLDFKDDHQILPVWVRRCWLSLYLALNGFWFRGQLNQ